MQATCPECQNVFTVKQRGRDTPQVYCSKKCLSAARMKKSIADWLAGLIPGGGSGGVAPFVKRWLISKFGERCSRCGWCERHPKTNKVPVQVDHVDGDPDNHRPENLSLLCPNCHSLTLTFGNLNRGRGRKVRRDRYRRQRLSGEAPLS